MQFHNLLFNCSVVSNSLWPHGLLHARLPCSASSPRVCSNSCSFNQRYYLTISSPVTHFFFGRQSFSASGSFPMSHLFTSDGQSIGASASVFPSIRVFSNESSLCIRWPKFCSFNFSIQNWFPLGLTGLIFLLSKYILWVLTNS